MDNDDRVIGVISLSDILKELVLKPSRNIILQLKKKKKKTFFQPLIYFFCSFSVSKKSTSSSDTENTGTIPEETGTDSEDEIELATRAELLNTVAAGVEVEGSTSDAPEPTPTVGMVCEDIAMMDDEEVECDIDGSNRLLTLCEAVNSMGGLNEPNGLTVNAIPQEVTGE